MCSIVFYYAVYFVIGNFYHPVDREIYYRTVACGKGRSGDHLLWCIQQICRTNRLNHLHHNCILGIFICPTRLMRRCRCTYLFACCYAFLFECFDFISIAIDCIYLGILFDTSIQL